MYRLGATGFSGIPSLALLLKIQPTVSVYVA